MLRPAAKRLTVLVALISVLASSGFFFVPDLSAFDSCNYYYNSSSRFFFGYGWACAGNGPGCRECVQLGTSGYTVCIESGATSFCYDYQY